MAEITIEPLDDIMTASICAGLFANQWPWRAGAQTERDIIAAAVGLSGDRALIARVGMNLAGIGLYGQAPWATGSWYLRTAATLPEFRRQGVHRALVTERLKRIAAAIDRPAAVYVSTSCPSRYPISQGWEIATSVNGIFHLVATVEPAVAAMRVAA